jgi:glycosyltransferase involved in cell wall biosynthesis
MTPSAAASSHNNRPIISICVPTFSRATCLVNLLENLGQLTIAHGSKIEICISDNQSTDDTAQIIEDWRGRLGLKVMTQTENIGATRNAIAVTSSATGKWLMIIGDDDLLIPRNFSSLLAILQSSDENDWILVGVADATGEERLLGDLKPGRYDAGRFREILLGTGLYRFGFIGMHVFPLHMQSVLAGLSGAASRPWPHLALFLRHLHGGHVQIFSAPVVEQAGGGGELYWSMGAWSRINLRKLNIIYEVLAELKELRWYFNALLLRELYSLENLKILVLWKALEPRDYYRSAFSEHIVRYMLLGPFAFLAAIHFVLLLAIYIMPSGALRIILRFVGKGSVIAKHLADKQAKSNFDGVKRGL